MFRNHSYRRKIIGGSLLGNLFSVAKDALTSATSGNLGSAAKNILKTGTSKVLTTAKDFAKNIGVSALTKEAIIDKGKQLAGTAFERGKQIAVDKAKSLGSKLGEKAVASLKTSTGPELMQAVSNAVKVAQRLKGQSIPETVKDKISEISKSPAVKKVLTEKAKEIVKQSSPNINSNSAAILSNLIAGSGIKRIR